MTDSESGKPQRDLAEGFFADVQDHLDAADATPTEPTEATHIGWAQVQLQRAIYHELRHGHDQTAAHAAAIEAQTKAMADLAHHLENVARHLGDR